MTFPRLSLREATSADAASIAAVHEASICVLGSDGYDDEQVQAWLSNVHPERYPLEQDGFRVVVADHEADGVVGFGLLDCEPAGRDDPSTGEIGAVYVHPDYARQGIGRAILETLESAARDAGLEALVLTASRNAVGFYERQGYAGVETVRLEMEDGVALACLEMRRQLVPE
ncbi:GNAT family N-acetyltransferase [Haloterrigena salifodinae]|uniref:GNAT family N-acetyltransferase n=1 Tax=Haloterrigena salifodinae TaxID=2675099 RepID=UPI000F886F9E|nr:GNAT family N-acetyltransferase [Haloterrigena salifodinae]